MRLALFAACLWASTNTRRAAAETRAARLVEGGEQQTSAAVAPILGPEPYPAVGPVVLSVLLGRCYELQKDRFEYSVCPFVNATQRRVISSSPVLLGLWGGVSYNHGGNLIQEYQNGHHCKGTSMYRSVVRYLCGDEVQEAAESLPALVDIASDEEGCAISATIATPFPCALLRTIPNASTPPPPLQPITEASYSEQQSEQLQTSSPQSTAHVVVAASSGTTYGDDRQPHPTCTGLAALIAAFEQVQGEIRELAAKQAAMATVVNEIKAWTAT
jgi:hypothetical protein